MSDKSGAMNLWEEYERLIDAALFAVEKTESVWGDHIFRPLLQPWIRERLESQRSLIRHADSQLDVADDTSDVIATAHHYIELRKELFSELFHFRAEAQWRLVGRAGDFAVRATLQSPNARPVFALRRDNRWVFTVNAPHPTEPGERTTLNVLVQQTYEDNRKKKIEFRIPAELRDHPEWLDQLRCGFEALGYAAAIRA
ncbi:hypothetical protein [Nocardia lijiangensis]|uniref:hypothetical protein n=1 Tax=Nocardia lijiangensis TaxID=299618 RepID=UPI0008334CA8|nr:hypothetical protein [Nocardia lijiangensis]